MESLFQPLEAKIVFGQSPVTGFPSRVTIHRIEQQAGAAPGSAIVSYAEKRAEDATPKMGCTAKISYGETLIFRGTIGHAPTRIAADDDTVELVLFDDKWAAGAQRIGQHGIGTQQATTDGAVGSGGFKDVVFDFVFNRDATPNKDPAALDFCTGSNAVSWTLKDIIKFIFKYYIPSTVATVVDAAFGDAAWARVPQHVDILDQKATQALDSICALAGMTWTFLYADAASKFLAIRPGTGTQRQVQLASVGTGGNASGANAWYATELTSSLKVTDCAHVFQVLSAPVIKETTYSTYGTNPMLVGVLGFKHEEFVARARVDVTKYAANNLGCNLTAGSLPKKIRTELCTRLMDDGTAYYSAAQLVSDRTLQERAKHAEVALWISDDGTEANARLCTGGYRIDTERGLIDFRRELELATATPGVRQKVVIADWTRAALWMTCSTVLETVQSVEDTKAGDYLATPACMIARQPHLVPERRLAPLWLPGLTNPTVVYKALATDPENPLNEEKYVDVTQALADGLTAAENVAPPIESEIEATFELFPLLNVGDLIAVKGRAIGALGTEVVVQLSYGLHHDFTTHIRATNAIAGVTPAKLAQRRR